MIKLQSLDHVALTVSDIARSAEWYETVLGMERRFDDVWGGVPTVVVAPGHDSGFALFPASTNKPDAKPNDENMLIVRHIAFRVDQANFEAAQTVLKQHGIKFVFSDHTVSHSIYFNDPDGHRLEITTYDI